MSWLPVRILMIGVLLSAQQSATAQATEVSTNKGVNIVPRIRQGVVAIRVTWNETKKDIETGKESEITKESHGTAFAIGGSPEAFYLITAAHVIPDHLRIEDVVVEAELRPPFVSIRGPAEFKVLDIDRSTRFDLAVLSPKNRTEIIKVALPSRLNQLEQGQLLSLLGHPEGGKSEFYGAQVAGEGADETVKLDTIVEEGFSGAPVFDDKGNVVCVVRGGDPVADIDKSKKVMGKALCTPVERLFRKWGFQPFGPHANDTGPSTPPTAITFSFDAEAAEAPIDIVKSIDVTKNDHPNVLSPHTSKPFRESISAPDNYYILDATFVPWSANGAKFVVERSKQRATLEYTLTSGPFVDQYRGWIKGKFSARIVRVQ